jgi:hypothetical protein
MNQSPEGVALPRGIIYDPARQRYRVRLYHFHRVVWLSYTRTLNDALADFNAAKHKQADVRCHTSSIRSVQDYVTALQQDLV